MNHSSPVPSLKINSGCGRMEEYNLWMDGNRSEPGPDFADAPRFHSLRQAQGERNTGLTAYGTSNCGSQ
jgi:hypothetical protein